MIGSAFGAYVDANRRIARRALSAPAITWTLAAMLVCQLAYGSHAAGALYGGLAFVFGNLAFMSIGIPIVRRMSEDARSRPLSAPRWQLLVVSVVVIVFIGALARQYPDPVVSENVLSRAILCVTGPAAHAVRSSLLAWRASASTADTISSAFVNDAICIALPVALLAPVCRDLPAYGVRPFSVRLALGLCALYVIPFALVGRPTASSSIAYFFVAALPEEFLFRALLQRRLKSCVRDPAVAIVVAATIFGLMHVPVMVRNWGWPWGLFFAIGVNGFGGAWLGYIYERTGSVWLVAAVHWLSGVAFGAAN